MVHALLRARLTFGSDDLHGIFDPVLKEINRLVEEQVNRVRIKRGNERPDIKVR